MAGKPGRRTEDRPADLLLDGHPLVGSHRPVPDETRAGGTLTRAAQEQSDGDFGEGQALPQRVRGRAPASRMSRDHDAPYVAVTATGATYSSRKG